MAFTFIPLKSLGALLCHYVLFFDIYIYHSVRDPLKVNGFRALTCGPNLVTILFYPSIKPSPHPSAKPTQFPALSHAPPHPRAPLGRAARTGPAHSRRAARAGPAHGRASGPGRARVRPGERPGRSQHAARHAAGAGLGFTIPTGPVKPSPSDSGLPDRFDRKPVEFKSKFKIACVNGSDRYTDRFDRCFNQKIRQCKSGSPV